MKHAGPGHRFIFDERGRHDSAPPSDPENSGQRRYRSRACVAGAASAHADAVPGGTDPNPFGALGCSCREPAPPGGMTGQIERGILAGLAASPGNRSIG